jgi:hypothetical protein
VTEPLRWRGLELPQEIDHERAPDAWHLDTEDLYVGVAREETGSFGAYVGFPTLDIDGAADDQASAPKAIGAALNEIDRKARLARAKVAAFFRKPGSSQEEEEDTDLDELEASSPPAPIRSALAELRWRRARVTELELLINTPHVADFLEAVRVEAAHQVEKWGSEHDDGKGPTDWFWLLGFLAGKAVWSAAHGDREKALHHVITTAAACLNWHAQLSGQGRGMRPGIETPKGEKS